MTRHVAKTLEWGHDEEGNCWLADTKFGYWKIAPHLDAFQLFLSRDYVDEDDFTLQGTGIFEELQAHAYERFNEQVLPLIDPNLLKATSNMEQDNG